MSLISIFMRIGTTELDKIKGSMNILLSLAGFDVWYNIRPEYITDTKLIVTGYIELGLLFILGIYHLLKYIITCEI